MAGSGEASPERQVHGKRPNLPICSSPDLQIAPLSLA
jgi:hypothetical protein